MSPVRVSNVLMRSPLPFLNLRPFHWCSWPTTPLENQLFPSGLKLPLNPPGNVDTEPYLAISCTWCHSISEYPKDIAFSGVLTELKLLCIQCTSRRIILALQPVAPLSLKVNYKSSCWNRRVNIWERNHATAASGQVNSYRHTHTQIHTPPPTFSSLLL